LATHFASVALAFGGELDITPPRKKTMKPIPLSVVLRVSRGAGAVDIRMPFSWGCVLVRAGISEPGLPTGGAASCAGMIVCSPQVDCALVPEHDAGSGRRG
jgi:hypothetical protein